MKLAIVEGHGADSDQHFIRLRFGYFDLIQGQLINPETIH